MALTSGGLSFNEEEVFALLVQTQWEFGSLGSNGAGDLIRKAHEDLLDSTFTLKMLEVIQTKVEENQKKWSDPFTLCCFTSIALRILEIGNVSQQRTRCGMRGR